VGPVVRDRAEKVSAVVTSALLPRRPSGSLVRNSIYVMATTVVTSALGYVFWIVAARSYSEHDVGLAAALISAMTLASMVSSLGPASTLVQMLPRRSAGHRWSLTLNGTLATGTVAGLFLGGVLVVVLPWLSSPFAVVRQDLGYPSLLVAGVLLTTVGVLLDHAFVAERAAGNMLARNVLFSVLRVPLLLPVGVAAGAGAIGILGAWVAATAASCAGGALLVRRLGRHYRSAVRGIGQHVRSMRSALAGHHLTSLGGALPMYLLPLLVAAVLSPTDNAYFYTTWMVCNVLFMVSFAVSFSLFAEGSHAPRELRRQVRVSVVATAAVLGPLLLVLLLGGPYVMAAFGPSYPEHVVPLLTLLALSALPEAVTNIYVSVLRVKERLRFAAGLTIAVAVLMLGLAWFLLPSFGLIGAGWAMLIAQTVGAAAVAADVTVRRRHAPPDPGLRGRVIALAGKPSPAHARRRREQALLRNTSRRAAFLCYHSVSADGPPPLCVTPETFERQLAALRRWGYASGDLAALHGLAEGRRLGAQHVFLTFDDGFRDNFSEALPLLDRYGFKALVFLVPPLVDSAAPLAWPEIGIWRDRYPGVLRSLSWSEVEAMADAGIEFGSHTLTHPSLPALDDERLRQELVESRARIKDRLGACEAVAYPFGAWDVRVGAAAIDAGYTFGFTLPYGSESVGWQRGATTMSIPRIPITAADDERRLRLKLTAAGRRVLLSRAVAGARIAEISWSRMARRRDLRRSRGEGPAAPPRQRGAPRS
jgi:O-antigen/teichoic acid export membrane protein/peptidoglycan/xylan/chitin deacetylase (PgdA/CDA1 family)